MRTSLISKLCVVFYPFSEENPVHDVVKVLNLGIISIVLSI
jgi:hypothetical protein